MRTRFCLPILLIGSLLLASCQGRGGVPWEHRFSAMGTEFRLLIPRGEVRNPESVFADVENLMNRMSVDLYPWADGQLAALNDRLAQGSAAQVSDELAGLLRFAQTRSRISEGFFDPGIGALVELWGFHQARPGTAGSPPSDEDIAALLEGCIGIRHLQIGGREIRSGCAGPMLDLGGVAKGHAVDQAMALIRNAGVAHALLDAGGDIRAMGRNGREPWRVGIQDPRGDSVLGSVALATGEAIFTSGDYERFFTHEGERYAHILDPATGRPVQHTASVTVLAGQGINADAAATAVFAAGPERWREIADKLGVRAVMRVDVDGRIEMTNAFDRRLEPAAGTELAVGAAAD